MTDVLEHYAPAPVVLTNRRYRQPDRVMSHQKPAGLWVSVKGEDDWPSWCRSEEFSVERLGVRHVITLREDANLLWIRGVQEIDAFHERYAKVCLVGSWGESYGLDWQAVAKDYDGVIIAPYVWARRMPKPVSDWYYSWDCSSGCIWRMRAIERMEVA